MAHNSHHPDISEWQYKFQWSKDVNSTYSCEIICKFLPQPSPKVNANFSLLCILPEKLCMHVLAKTDLLNITFQVNTVLIWCTLWNSFIHSVDICWCSLYVGHLSRNCIPKNSMNKADKFSVLVKLCSIAQDYKQNRSIKYVIC